MSINGTNAKRCRNSLQKNMLSTPTALAARQILRTTGIAEIVAFSTGILSTRNKMSTSHLFFSSFICLQSSCNSVTPVKQSFAVVIFAIDFSLAFSFSQQGNRYCLCFRVVVQKLCHSMKGQIMSRAFYGCKCCFKRFFVAVQL